MVHLEVIDNKSWSGKVGTAQVTPAQQCTYAANRGAQQAPGSVDEAVKLTA
jgi:hypothetical protein